MEPRLTGIASGVTRWGRPLIDIYDNITNNRNTYHGASLEMPIFGNRR